MLNKKEEIKYLINLIEEIRGDVINKINNDDLNNEEIKKLKNRGSNLISSIYDVIGELGAL